MRFALLASVALLVAGCDGGAEVPEPVSRGDAAANAAAEAVASKVVLGEDRLTVGSESFYFNAGRSEVETALTRALGEQDDSVNLDECGAGPMVGTTYPGGLTVNFQDGALIGWFLRGGSDSISLAGETGIGTPRDAIAGLEPVEDSTLGDEFGIADSDLRGFFGEDGTVETLYAGTQCFFR